MKIETKFNNGDFVYPIVKHGNEVYVKCKTCGGHGNVAINNTNREIKCPDCYGNGSEYLWVPEKWQLSNDSGFVGRIGVEIYAKKYRSHKNSYRYMLSSTGVGSGTLWDESDLFLTKEEALEECDKRNKEESLS